jgi:hypothetical protein
MTPVQQKAWLAALNSEDDERSPRRWDTPPTPTQAAQGAFRLKTNRSYERLFVRTLPDGSVNAMSISGAPEELDHPGNLQPGYEPYDRPWGLDQFVFLYLFGKPALDRAGLVSIPDPAATAQ